MPRNNRYFHEFSKELDTVKKIKPKFRTMVATESTYLDSDKPRILDFADLTIRLISEQEIDLTDKQLWDCRQIINRAQDISPEKKYEDASKDILMSVVQNLSINLKTLYVLYSLHEYELVENSINKYFKISNDTEQLALLTEEITKQCDNKCRAMAKLGLENMIEEYTSLPQGHRESLEEQYAYIIMLDKYLISVRNNPASLESLTLRLQEAMVLLNSNIKKAIANKFMASKVEQIKQKLYDKANDKRSSDFSDKFVSSSLKFYGLLAPLNYALSFTPPVAAVLSTFIVPGVAALEAIGETFPELDAQHEFLDRPDLNSSDKIFLYQQDSDWGYEPNSKRFFAATDILSVTNNNIYLKTQEYFSKKINEYIADGKKKLKEVADENVLNDVRSSQLLFDEVLMAAGKTLAGMVFITCFLLLTVLLAVGLTGPILLFAMSPALSVGLIGAAAVAGLKYMYPDPKTPAGFILEKVVNVIFAPIYAIYLVAERISRPLLALYDAVTKKLAQKVAVSKLSVNLDLPVNDGLSVDFASLYQAAPDLLPNLIRYFKSEEQALRVKMDAVLNGKSDLSLEQITRDFSFLQVFLEVFKANGNKPAQFSMHLEMFLQERYRVERDNFESIAKKPVQGAAYVEPERKLLSFNTRPNFFMFGLLEHKKEQQNLRDLQYLKQQMHIIKPRLAG